MHFIYKLKNFVVPNINYNNYNDDFVDYKYDYVSKNRKNAKLVIILQY